VIQAKKQRKTMTGYSSIFIHLNCNMG